MSENIPTINPDQADAMHRQAKIDGTILRECALNSLVPVVTGLKHEPHVTLALANALAQQTFSIVKDRGMNPADLEMGANYIMQAFGQFLSELYHEAIAAGTKGDTIVAQANGYANDNIPRGVDGRVDIEAMNAANCPDIAHGGREEDDQDNEEGA